MHRVFLVVVLSSSHFDFELSFFLFFFFNATATTEIYTLSLHDALPISFARPSIGSWLSYGLGTVNQNLPSFLVIAPRSEEHTSELQSLTNLVCRLLLEKKKKKNQKNNIHNKQINNNMHNYHNHTHTNSH